MRVQTRCNDVVDLVQALRETRNDLMPTAMSQQRVVVKVYRKLVQQAGCLMTRMSGSGSTCFGVFADATTARAAAKAMAAEEPTWWVKATRLMSVANPPPPPPVQEKVKKKEPNAKKK